MRRNKSWLRPQSSAKCASLALLVIIFLIPDAGADARNADEVEVRLALERWYKAWNAEKGVVDFDSLERLFAPGEISVVDDFGGQSVELLQLLGIPEYLGARHGGVLRVASHLVGFS